MGKQKAELTEGYQGTQKHNSAIEDGATSAVHLSKKQHGNTEALLSSNKGSLAMQGGNGSTAIANSFSATGNVHNANAENSTRFLKDTAQHEESASHSQAGESRQAENMAMDLNKVNRG